VTFGALAVPSRRQLLQALRAAAAPVDAQALAAVTGLHPNTVRFHLDVLIKTGFVREHPARQGRRGRPRTVYEAATAAVQNGGYELLASVLVGHLAQNDGGDIARKAGWAWAQQLRQHSPDQPDDVDTTVNMISALFTELGFQPAVATNDGQVQMTLHACPFWSLAEDHPGIVCAMHLGLLQGLVERDAQAPIEARLTPFVRPRQCQADLVYEDGPAGD
jgi:predicted ArsR family transcriptional regulator